MAIVTFEPSFIYVNPQKKRRVEKTLRISWERGII